MKRHLITIVLSLLFLLGLSLLLYPIVTSYQSTQAQQNDTGGYIEAVQVVDTTESDALRQSAQEYNAAIAARGNKWVLTDEELAEYNQQLRLQSTEVMSFVEIPSLGLALPIYHGTDEIVLQTGIGHIEGSSLPVGGESTHCVISGHRGLPSARLFTDIDKMVIGDYFVLTTLGEKYYYEVDNIITVLPTELQHLEIVPGSDRCTLVTCTPYGINTHRLLVQAHRIDGMALQTVVMSADALQINPLVVSAVIAAPVLLILFIVGMVAGRKKPNGSSQTRRSS